MSTITRWNEHGKARDFRTFAMFTNCSLNHMSIPRRARRRKTRSGSLGYSRSICDRSSSRSTLRSPTVLSEGIGVKKIRMVLRALLLALTLVPPSAAFSEDPRLVPQFGLTNFNPWSVTFHPKNRNLLLILNQEGRIDLLDIRKWSEPVKILELPGQARSVAFDPDGQHLISGGFDGTLRFWDAASGAVIGKTARSHGSPVSSVGSSIDGNLIASGGENGTVQLWNKRNRAAIGNTMPGHDGRVSSVVFSADGKRIVSHGGGSLRVWRVTNNGITAGNLPSRDAGVWTAMFDEEGGNVLSIVGSDPRLWDEDRGMATGETIRYYGNHVWSMALSPDRKRLVLGDWDGTVRMWDTVSGLAIGDEMRGHDGPVMDIAFSSDGKRLASVGSGALQLWDVESGGAMGQPMRRHEGPVWCVAFSPDGRHVISGGDDGKIGLWKVESGTAVDGPSWGHNGPVYSLAFSPDGKKVVSGGNDNMVRLWDLEDISADGKSMRGYDGSVSRVAFGQSGHVVVSLGRQGTLQTWAVGDVSGLGQPVGIHGPWPASLEFSPDGRHLAIGWHGGILELWNVENRTSVGQLVQGPEFSVSSIAFGSGGNQVASGANDGAIRLWNIDDPTPIGQTMKGHDRWVSSLAFSAEAKRIVSGGADGMVRMWNAESMSAIGERMGGHENQVLSLEFSPDARRFVSGGYDGTVRLWDTESISAIGADLEGQDNRTLSGLFDLDRTLIVSLNSDGMVRLWNPESDAPVAKLNPGHRDFVSSLALSPDGTRVALGYDDGTVRFWNVEEGSVVGGPLPKRASTISYTAFSPDGTRIVSVSSDRKLQLWDAGRGAVIVENLRQESYLWQPNVAFNPESEFFVSGGHDGRVRLWDTKTGAALGETTQRHGGPVSSVMFSPDGELIVSGGHDGELRIWDVGNLAANPQTFQGHDSIVSGVAFSPDGKHVVSGGNDGTVTRWQTVNGLEEEETTATCALSDIRWLSQNVIIGGCLDRFVFLDGKLGKRGEMFVLAEGLVAISAGQGVYATYPPLKDRVIAFRGTENLGTSPPISFAAIEQALFDEWSIGSRLQVAAESFLEQIKEWHGDQGSSVYVLWLLFFWLLAVLLVIMMWLCFPARLAWMSMPKAGIRSRFQWSLFPQKYFFFIIALTWFAQSRRPLRKWLQKHRNILEEGCFTGRQPVREREKFWSVGHEEVMAGFGEKIWGNERGLLWIHGVGGVGKSALAMHILRNTLIGKRKAPVPIFVGEDWTGSLAAQVAVQLRHSDWQRGPTEEMVKTLGAAGLICPLVDSLSERGMGDALRSVKNGILNHHFRHLIVTSRDKPPDDQIWQSMTQITPRPLVREDTRSFVQIYVAESEVNAIVGRIESLLDATDMPSPLFLRFAIEQAALGPLKAVDRLSLVLAYVEALRSGRVDIYPQHMRRSAAIAATTSVQDHLASREFSEQQLHQALTSEGNEQKFTNVAGKELMAPTIVEVLVQSGLIVRGRTMSRLQFAYDPVAEYLAAWWVKESPDGKLNALRERIENSEKTEVGRAYREISAVV